MSDTVKFTKTIRKDSHGPYIRIPFKLVRKHNLIDGVIVKVIMEKVGGRERTVKKTKGRIVITG